MRGRRILLIVGGGIAAYKACELVRLIRKAEGAVTCVLTEGGAKFVTAMSLAALSENPVHTTLWDLKDEVEMGHIQLSRQADLVVVCPATADLLARMAAGIADDLATTLLLATDKPVMAVPAMNVRMWQHAATARNVARLRDDGVAVMEPDEGAMACGEWGPGRLPEPETILAGIRQMLDAEPVAAEESFAALSASTIPRQFAPALDEDETAAAPPAEAEPAPPLEASGLLLPKKGKARAAPPTDPDALDRNVDAGPIAEGPPNDGPLRGCHVLITAGPTHEPIDPVRYIANRSSGRQGYAIAAAAARAGADVTLVSGPVALPTPPGVRRIDVESAREMADAVKASLPADVAIMVAAVADWRTRDVAADKMKKRGSAPPALILTENPDILANVGASGRLRPQLLIGFAAETENVIANATEKRKRKGADWIIANDVSGDVMGGHANTVHIVTASGVESLPQLPKDEVAEALVDRIAAALAAD
ncbi:MAG: bifunctional phosphopantothenoylcysteine decarboxylase/phosphopantothenate synthase [Novosphingobium sp.]|nr:bifunctional phosphopantothenoylcysteine decarboxylase/phosphopantothenate synthase [Novosphingobium sp.]